jgi:hypothetical protein
LIGKFVLVYTPGVVEGTTPYTSGNYQIDKVSGNYQIYKVLGVSSEKGSNASNVQYTQHNCIKYDLKLFDRINNRVTVAVTDNKYDFDCTKTKCGEDDAVMAVKPVLLFHGTRTSSGRLSTTKKEYGDKFAVLDEMVGSSTPDEPRLTIKKDEHDNLGEHGDTFLKWAIEEKKRQTPPNVLSSEEMSAHIKASNPDRKNTAAGWFSFGRTNKENDQQKVINRTKGVSPRNKMREQEEQEREELFGSPINSKKRNTRKNRDRGPLGARASAHNRGERIEDLRRKTKAMENEAAEFAKALRELRQKRRGWGGW